MKAEPEPPAPSADLAALARGGRINFFGFVLRLAARLPFLFIAGRMYGAEALGRFAYAVLVVEFAAQLATLYDAKLVVTSVTPVAVGTAPSMEPGAELQKAAALLREQGVEAELVEAIGDIA